MKTTVKPACSRSIVEFGMQNHPVESYCVTQQCIEDYCEAGMQERHNGESYMQNHPVHKY